MTIIAAIHDSATGSTWIGSDTMLFDQQTVYYGISKWVVAEPWAIGVAGHLRTKTLIEQAARADGFENAEDIYDLTERLRFLMTRDNYNTDNSEMGARDYGQQIIVAHPDAVWQLCGTLSITPAEPDSVAADGSGRAYALGAAHAMHGRARPCAMLNTVISAACTYCITCGGEPFIHRLRKGQP